MFAGIPPTSGAGGNRGGAPQVTRSSPPGGPHQLLPGHPLMVPPHSSAGPLPPSNHGPSQQQTSQHPHHPATSINGGPPSSTPPYAGPPTHAHPPPPSSTASGVGGGAAQIAPGNPGQAPSPMQSSPMQSLISVADTILPVSSSPRGSPPTGPTGAAQLSRTPSRGSQHSPSSSGINAVVVFIYYRVSMQVLIMTGIIFRIGYESEIVRQRRNDGEQRSSWFCFWSERV